MGPEVFVDYYELLQISPNADVDTIQRVFRHLAKKYHPDAPGPGDPEHFNRLLEAYRTLSTPELRASYDVSYQSHWTQRWRVAEEASSAPVLDGDADLRHRVLSLLYVQRRRNMRSPGMGEHELDKLLDVPAQLLAFHVWYLREKGWIQRLDTGHVGITADGVDQMELREIRLPPERLIESRPDLLEAEGEASAGAPAAKTGVG